jgi:biotin transport system permease protein
MSSPFLAEDSWAHRLPVSVKVIGLAIFTFALFSIRDVFWAVGALILITIGYATLGKLACVRIASFRFLIPILLLIGSLQAVFVSLESSIAAVAKLLAAFLMADLVTATTPMLSMMDFFTRLFQPFKRLGFDPGALALAFALVLRFGPALLSDYERRREAWRARGGRGAGLMLLPAWIAGAIRISDRIAEALDARGACRRTEVSHD